MTRLQTYRKKIDRGMAAYRAARTAVKEDRAAVTEAEDLLFDTEEAHRAITAVAQAVQEQAHDRIAGVVSRCLEMVFDEPYEFRIMFEKKRNRTEARLVFVREGQEINPLDASGGGVVDVAAFALRLSCLMLARPARRRLVILDEPFKFVSAEYRARVRAMLEGLAEDMGVQFIMVTHIDELRTGTIVEIS